mgnify:CR=1 FL=1
MVEHFPGVDCAPAGHDKGEEFFVCLVVEPRFFFDEVEEFFQLLLTQAHDSFNSVDDTIAVFEIKLEKGVFAENVLEVRANGDEVPGDPIKALVGGFWGDSFREWGRVVRVLVLLCELLAKELLVSLQVVLLLIGIPSEKDEGEDEDDREKQWNPNGISEFHFGRTVG